MFPQARERGKQMKKRNIALLSVCALLLALPSFGQKMQTVRGEGRYVSQNLEKLPAFNAVDVRGDAEVDFTQQPGSSVTVSGRENLVALADVRVEDGVLVVGFTRPVHIRGEHHLRVAVAAPELRSVTLSQGGDFEVHGMLKTADLTISATQDSEFSADFVQASAVSATASGRAEIDLGRLEADRVRAVASDRADIDLSGKAREAFVENNGSGEIDADDLRADTVHAYVNGSGDVKVYASNLLHAVANGRGKIEYKGNPMTLNREGSAKKIIRDRDYD